MKPYVRHLIIDETVLEEMRTQRIEEGWKVLLYYPTPHPQDREHRHSSPPIALESPAHV